MAQLNQIIAVANGKKAHAQKALTDIYHRMQKEGALHGLSKSYRPKDEDGDKLPSESKRVQATVSEALEATAAVLTDMFDVLATQEYANCEAFADVVVNGSTVLAKVPVTYLLFLEKQLVDFATLVEKLPTLDPSFEWEYSQAQACWATKPTETTRTKKVPKNHVKAEATDKHPAQVEIYHEDILAGYWTTIQYSGAIPVSEKQALQSRVRNLIDAVKMAREQANSIEVDDRKVGAAVFAYLLKK